MLCEGWGLSLLLSLSHAPRNRAYTCEYKMRPAATPLPPLPFSSPRLPRLLWRLLLFFGLCVRVCVRAGERGAPVACPDERRCELFPLRPAYDPCRRQETWGDCYADAGCAYQEYLRRRRGVPPETSTTALRVAGTGTRGKEKRRRRGRSISRATSSQRVCLSQPLHGLVLWAAAHVRLHGGHVGQSRAAPKATHLLLFHLP